MKSMVVVGFVSLFAVVLALPAWADLQQGLDAYQNMDYENALKELRPLAQKGDAKAQLYMGLMCDSTPGLPQDFKKAAQWYRKAAEQGDAEAQYRLGQMYVDGLGVPQSFVLGVMWWNLAAEKGHVKARQFRDALLEALTPDQIAEAQRMAREWRPKKGQR